MCRALLSGHCGKRCSPQCTYSVYVCAICRSAVLECMVGLAEGELETGEIEAQQTSDGH